MRTTIDIFNADGSIIGELTVGTDFVRGEDALDREVMYFYADLFAENDTTVHIDADVLLDLVQQHYRSLGKPTGTFTLTTVGEIEYDEPFSLFMEDTLSVVFTWGLTPPMDMTVIAYPAYYETGLLTGSEPFEVLVSTKELYACLFGLFMAQQ